MPLLQSIVHELDCELNRLREIRRIVAGLSRTSAVVRRLSVDLSATTAVDPLPAGPDTAEQAGKLRRRARSDAGRQRGSRPQVAHLAEPRALASAVPSGPVVFYPGRQQSESSKQPKAQPMVLVERTAEELETASRALAARWASSAHQ